MIRKSDKEDSAKDGQEPIPFDEALRRLVNTPPEPKKKPKDKPKKEAEKK